MKKISKKLVLTFLCIVLLHQSCWASFDNGDEENKAEYGVSCSAGLNFGGCGSVQDDDPLSERSQGILTTLEKIADDKFDQRKVYFCAGFASGCFVLSLFLSAFGLISAIFLKNHTE